MNAVIERIGGLFSPEQYLFWTRIECIAWTAADVALIFAMLRLGDLARRAAGREPHRVSYIVLALTLLAALGVPLSPNGRMIFLAELAVTIPHFLIIIYVLVADLRAGAALLRALIAPSSNAGHAPGREMS